MTAQELAHWVADHDAVLRRSNVAGEFGRAPDFGANRGVTWLNLWSRAARARIVRAADGSATVDAFMLGSGVRLLGDRHAELSNEQVEGAVAALGAAPQR
jgi:hypothetical protein